MALTRKLLKGMGLTEEQIDSVIDAHTETVEGLKSQVEQYKGEAEKLTDVQKQLDDLKAGSISKADYDKLKNEFDGYKADMDSKETLTKVKAAYRKLLDDQKINSADADLIMAATRWDGMKLDKDGALENANTLTEGIKTNYARYIPSIETRGANVDKPPKQGGDSGANSRAAQIAKERYERMYGKPQNTDNK